MKEIDKQNFTNYMEVKSFGDIFPKKAQISEHLMSIRKRQWKHWIR